MEQKEFILCSAVHYKNGAKSNVIGVESGTVIFGKRHNDCNIILRCLFGDSVAIPEREQQGFLTSQNRYVSRSEAFKIAKSNKQIIHKMFDNDREGSLTSEDLYGCD